MKTVCQEMSEEQRREELIMGLSNTGSDVVIINFSNLAHAVGMVEAEKHIQSLTVTNELVNPVFSPRSTLRQHHRCNALCQVDRVTVLEAILKAKADTTKKKIDAKIPSQ
jgi:hypothetical protein